MAYTYLGLVNRLCYKLNEVPLTSSDFATADGVYDDFKQAINAAIRDIYQEEDNRWPFAWNETTFTTTVGTKDYTANASAELLDWDSFAIMRNPISVDSITQTGGTATATVSAGHQLQDNDSGIIKDADQSGYNLTANITYSSATEFTYAVDSSTTSPATGTIVLYPPYTTEKLERIDWYTYVKDGKLERDTEMFEEDEYGKPQEVVRRHDNNIVVTPKPDRIYTIRYEYFAPPTNLSAHSDVPDIPAEYEEVIVDGAIYHGYFFRDNLEQATITENKYKDGVNRMRRILIPQADYMRAID